jgi:non-ribosomal peptide synthetase component F
LPLPVVDLRSLPAEEREAVALSCATAEAHCPFDLARAPLMRTMLLRLDAADHMLLMTIHHIISDGWSLGVLVREIAALYDAFAAGRPAPLPELPIQYVDYAAWQRQWMQGKAQAKQFAYWKESLREPLPRLELPADRPRPRVQTFHGTHQTFAFPQSLAAALTKLGQQENVTLFMIMLAAFNIVLHYYTGSEDIVVGTDVANRNRAEVEGLIGFFVNQLVLRTDLSGNPACRELLGRVRRVALGAYAHQEFPFAKLVELLNPARSLQYAPMFQVKLVLQNAPIPTFDHADLTMTPLDVNITTSQLDLILSVAETERGLEGELEYNVDLFDAARMNRLLEHFEAVLGLIAARPDHTLSAIEELLAEADNRRHQLQEQQCLTASQQRLKLVKRKATQVVAKEKTP